jgi:hypothetical protein
LDVLLSEEFLKKWMDGWMDEKEGGGDRAGGAGGENIKLRERK